MSDPNDTQPAKPVDAPAESPVPATKTVADIGDAVISAAENRSAKRSGAVASICDALKELFEHAPKRALGWVCAGVSFFVVLCGVGIMVALIQYGWPSMAAKQLKNWEVIDDSGKAKIELRTATEDGKIATSWIDVPKEVADPKAWATKFYGEQQPLKQMPLIPTDTEPIAPVVLTPGEKT